MKTHLVHQTKHQLHNISRHVNFEIQRIGWDLLMTRMIYKNEKFQKSLKLYNLRKFKTTR